MKKALHTVKFLEIFRTFSIHTPKFQRGAMSKNSFYAVKRGHQPGVYNSWNECAKQVSGFSHAVFRKFPTHEAAQAFVDQKNAVCNVAKNSSKGSDEVKHVPPGQFAASLMPQELQPLPISQIRRINDTNKGASRSHKGQGKNIKKKGNKCDADLVVTLFQRVEELEKEVAELKGKHKSDSVHVNEPPNKQMKLEEFQNAPHVSSVSEKQGNKGLEIPKTMVHVYTDGACTNNGKSGAKAGIGVYWGPEHPLNVSERLPGRQTNNRAEIQAAVRALQQAKTIGIQELTLYTDSNFLINGVTKWVKKWKCNGWKLSTGQPVINRTDFEDLERAAAGLTVKWVHVPGHKGFAGNEAADYLAVQGIKKDVDDDVQIID